MLEGKKEIKEKELKDMIEQLENLREVQKFQFDYFKLMVTLNLAFITALIALVRGVFESPKVAILIMLAFIFLMVSLLCSVITLLIVGNIILWMKGIPVYLKTEQKEKAEKLYKKVLCAFDEFDIVQRVVNYSFGLGFFALFVFAGWNFWSLV